MVRIYIAGKVTGCDYAEACFKFAEAERTLTHNGAITVNPMRFVPENADWQHAMKLCIKSLVSCDVLYLLEDWHESEGAVFEVMVAKRLGIVIQTEDGRRKTEVGRRKTEDGRI